MRKEIIITQPLANEYPERYKADIALVDFDDLIQGLKESFCSTFDFCSTLM